MSRRHFSENLTILVAKVETTPGTMETITTADFNCKVFNPAITVAVEPDDEGAKYANGNHSEDVSVMGVQSGTISFGIKLQRADTDLATAPAWAKFAYGAGCAPVSYSGTGWGLQPLKSYDNKTLTVWVYKIETGITPKAVCFKYAGCMGTMAIAGEGTGKPIMLNFAFSGKLVDVDFDVASASIPEVNNVDDTCYERLIGTAVSIDGYNRRVEAFSLDTGNTLSMIKDMGEDTGIENFEISDRNPRFSVNPLMVGATGVVKDDYDYLFGSVTGCPTTPAVIVDMRNFYLDIPKAQLMTLTPGGRDGISHFDQVWKCVGNGYTGVVANAALPYECTWELLQGVRSV